VGYFEFTDLHEEKIPNLQIPMLQVTAEPVMEFHQAREKAAKAKTAMVEMATAKAMAALRGAKGGIAAVKVETGKRNEWE